MHVLTYVNMYGIIPTKYVKMEIDRLDRLIDRKIHG